MTNIALKSYLTNSLFTRLGYEIIDLVNGVYHLRSVSNGKVTFDGVGLLVTMGPIDDSSPVYFCELDAKESIADPSIIESMISGWQICDARRLPESGILTAPVNRPFFGKVVEDQVQVERPNGGLRYFSVMESGDVICHN